MQREPPKPPCNASAQPPEACKHIDTERPGAPRLHRFVGPRRPTRRTSRTVRARQRIWHRRSPGNHSTQARRRRGRAPLPVLHAELQARSLWSNEKKGKQKETKKKKRHSFSMEINTYLLITEVSVCFSISEEEACKHVPYPRNFQRSGPVQTHRGGSREAGLLLLSPPSLPPSLPPVPGLLIKAGLSATAAHQGAPHPHLQQHSLLGVPL
ncbi:unnamed protein product [Pleuronectes platessa]|uniref:Uncharacterized protein n=1 Tax=Pleuronectes platessa TaxID=8262 RepID=A0A9N7U7U6_PLEPL|nr:unnamed protein product [Pleuronectes platessa]